MGELAYLVIDWWHKGRSRAAAKEMAFHHLGDGCGARWLGWRVDRVELIGDFCSAETGDTIQIICPGCGAVCTVPEPTFASGTYVIGPRAIQ